MIGVNPTGRFSSRAGDYARYRPSYPPEIIALLQRECGLTGDSVVADIGSGTGLLAELFLKLGCSVRGIEPNAEMRRVGEGILAPFPKFESINATAEHTGLPGASVDLVVAGQSFHWFNAPAARTEFCRILRHPRWAVLIWNERRVSEGFLAGYEDLVHRWAPEYQAVDHRRIDSVAFSQFFGHAEWRLATFENHQEFDFAGVQGRLQSSSYAPPPQSDNFQPMMNELERLFQDHQTAGKVRFLYDTKAYFGKL